MTRKHPRTTDRSSREDVIDHLSAELRDVMDALRRGLERPNSDVTANDLANDHPQRRNVADDLKSVALEWGLLRRVLLHTRCSKALSVSLDGVDIPCSFLEHEMTDAADEFTPQSERHLREGVDRAQNVTRASEEVVAVLSRELESLLCMAHGTAAGHRGNIPSARDLDSQRDAIGRQLHTVQRASQRMNKLVADILDLARAKAGQVA